MLVHNARPQLLDAADEPLVSWLAIQLLNLELVRHGAEKTEADTAATAATAALKLLRRRKKAEAEGGSGGGGGLAALLGK